MFLAFDGNIYRFVAPETVPVAALSRWGIVALSGYLALAIIWRRWLHFASCLARACP